MLRILACPYSVRLAESLPKPLSGNAASAGTIMHSEFERVMSGGKLVIGPTVLKTLIDQGYTHKWAHDMLAASVTGAKNLITKYKISSYSLEKRVQSGSIINVSDFWGTADFIGTNNQCSNLLIADLKTGRRIVSPEKNEQLLSYAMGAFAELEHAAQESIETVTLSIIQPANPKGTVSVWETTVDALYEFGAFVKEQTSKVDKDDLRPTPSLSACRWCPGRLICPEDEI